MGGWVAICKLSVAALFVVLLVPNVVQASHVSTTWTTVFQYAIGQRDEAPSGTLIWIEQCADPDGEHSCYKVWSRASSATVHRQEVSWFVPTAFYAVLGPDGTTPQTFTLYKGDGTQDTESVQATGTLYGAKWLVCSGVPCTSSNNFFQIGGWATSDIATTTTQVSCTTDVVGTPTTGSLSGGSVVASSRSQNLQLNSTYASGRSAEQCRTGDTLLNEFNPVKKGGECTVTAVPFVGARPDGELYVAETKLASACDCIPDGWLPGGKSASDPTQCFISPGVGDPADPLNSPTGLAGPSGSSLPGTTTTVTQGNAPAPSTSNTGSNPPSGGVGGMPSSWGSTDPPPPPPPTQYGSSSGTAGNITGITSDVTGAIGSSVGSAVGTAIEEKMPPAVKEGVKDALEELPANTIDGPTYDTTVEAPAEADILDLIGDFLSGNPLVSWATGSGVQASAPTCSFTLTLVGKLITFSLCPWETHVAFMGTLLLGIAGLYSVYIAMGVY